MRTPKVGEHIVAHFPNDNTYDALVLKPNEPGYTVVKCCFVSPANVAEATVLGHLGEAWLPHVTGTVLKHGYWRFPNELPREE
jgi:hypothetical protein